MTSTDSTIPADTASSTTNKTRILVTGATGFIGLVYCQHLIDKNVQVRVLLRDGSKAASLPANLNAQEIIGDLSDSELMRSACQGIDTVVHLAGIAHVAGISEKQLWETNTAGTRNLLDAAIDAKVRRLVFVSSSLAQAAEPGGVDATSYGKSKWAAEKELHQAQDKGQIETVILRPVNVYGAGMKGNISGMISMLDSGRLPPLPALTSRISLVSADDMAQALRLATNVEQAVGKTYAITDGEMYVITDIEKAIYQTLGKRLPSWRTPHMILYAASLVAGLMSPFHKIARKGGGITGRTYRNLVSDNLFSNAEISAELGFKPTTTLYRDLPEIVRVITRR